MEEGQMSDATLQHSVTHATRPAPAGPRPDGPRAPAMLSHVAYITRDSAATADFYSRIMGMELVNAVLDDAIPSTGEPIPYFHSFFRMLDGSTIAFFEAPELPPLSGPPHPAYNTFQHIALQVGSTELVDEWHRWLVANSIDVLGPIDHRIIYSIYFHDLTGSAWRSPRRCLQSGTTISRRRRPVWPTGKRLRRRPAPPGQTWSRCWPG
jgi:catechol 2,3-dioxygenase-like lactoylglutathione lyase family enzyme